MYADRLQHEMALAWYIGKPAAATTSISAQWIYNQDIEMRFGEGLRSKRKYLLLEHFGVTACPSSTRREAEVGFSSS